MGPEYKCWEYKFIGPIQKNKKTITNIQEDTNNKLETADDINKFLETKGTSFAINPKIIKNEQSNTEIKHRVGLEHCFFQLRWKHLIESHNPNQKENNTNTPFGNSNPKLPPKTDNVTESKITLLRDEINQSIIVNHNREFDNLDKQLIKISKFCKEQKMVIIHSDKTKKNILISHADFMELGNKYIKERPNEYKKVKHAKSYTYLKLGNNIINTLKTDSNFSKRMLNQCIKQEAHPAQITFNIKDHKKRNSDGSFPLRIIASCHGTPCDGVDFIVQGILTEACKLVPSYIQDTIHFLHKLDAWNSDPFRGKWKIASLDVDSLYPSIPLKDGIDIVVTFLYRHKHLIDLHEIQPSLMHYILEYLCYHYEVQFNNNCYLQMKGVPMGARFAPPFAIIVMDFVETLALAKIKSEYDVPLFVRYIDDIFIVVPDEMDITFLVDTFNSIHKNIQFTIEHPDKDGYIAFLDTEVKLNYHNIFTYKWFTKPVSSGNMLSAQSKVPHKVKRGFINNCFSRIIRRCNNISNINTSIKKMAELLKRNGYNNKIVKNGINHAINKCNEIEDPNKDTWNKDNGVILKIPYMNDELNQTIKNKIANTNLNITFCNNKFTQLNKLGYKPRTEPKCRRKCNICKILPDKWGCSTDKVVYIYTCIHCRGHYIGKTYGRISGRHSSHKSNFTYQNYGKSALSTHILEVHPEFFHDKLDNFTLDILDSFHKASELIIAEALYIEKMSPSLNRKQERTDYLL